MAGQADDESPAALVRRANEHVAAGAIPEALAEYAAAEKLLPGSPAIAYNRGVAQYRAGEYAQAAESFTRALVTRDPALEARARFNLGNTAYALALRQQGDAQAAVEKLKEAIGHYRAVLEMAPDDLDARANIERAQTLIRQLLEQPPPQQQNQRSSGADPNQSPESQPSEKQPASQPSRQQERSDANGRQPPPPDPNATAEASPSESHRAEDPNRDPSRENDASPQADPNQSADDPNQPAGEIGAGEEDTAQPRDPNRAPGAAATQKAMSREEAERLLQLIRDRERQRRAELARRQRAAPVPVEKDW